MTEPAVAEVALVRLRGRNGLPTGSLVKGVAGIKAVALVASGEVFPVLVDNLPADLRAEYDAFKAELEAVAAAAAAPAPVEEAPVEAEAEEVEAEEAPAAPAKRTRSTKAS